jgi:hypothetical protein
MAPSRFLIPRILPTLGLLALVLIHTREERDFKPLQVRFANRQIDYSMTTDEVGRACSSDTQLFIFVPSRPTSFDVREQIRRTWASKMVGLLE